MSMSDKFRKSIFAAVFVAISLGVSVLENMIPTEIFLSALPGVKLGLSNIVSISALFLLGNFYALTISILRPLLTLLAFGNVFSFALSVFGGVLSIVSAMLVKKAVGKSMSFVGLCVVSAFFHSLGQTIMCTLLMNTKMLLFTYFPIFALASIVMGIISGILLNFLFPKLENVFKFRNNTDILR